VVVREGSQFACVCVGDKFTPDYVRNLYRGVERGCQDSFGFTVFVDDATREGVAREVGHLEGVRIEEDRVLKGGPVLRDTGNWYWWAKLNVFRDDLWEPGSMVLYLDLDSVVRRNLDRLMDRQRFHMIGWPRNGNRLGSGVMLVPAGKLSDLFHGFKTPMIDQFPKGDQYYIAREVADIGRFTVSDVCSYKKHWVRRGWRRMGSVHASVVAFHGNPMPHQLPEGDGLRRLWSGGYL